MSKTRKENTRILEQVESLEGFSRDLLQQLFEDLAPCLEILETDPDGIAAAAASSDFDHLEEHNAAEKREKKRE